MTGLCGRGNRSVTEFACTDTHRPARFFDNSMTQKNPCCVDVGKDAKVQTMSSSKLNEVPSVSFESEVFSPNENDCLKLIDW